MATVPGGDSTRGVGHDGEAVSVELADPFTAGEDEREALNAVQLAETLIAQGMPAETA